MLSRLSSVAPVRGRRLLSSTATTLKKKIWPNPEALFNTNGKESTSILSPRHFEGDHIRVGSIDVAVDPPSKARPVRAGKAEAIDTGAEVQDTEGQSASEKARFLNISALKGNFLDATDVDTPRPIDFTDQDASLLQASAQVAQMVPGANATSRHARYGATQTSAIGDSAMGSAGPSTTQQTTSGAWAASVSEGVEGPATDPSALREQIDATERESMRVLKESGGDNNEAMKREENKRRGAAYSGPLSQQSGGRRGGRTYHTAALAFIKTGAGVAEPSLYGPPPASDTSAKQYPSKSTPEWAKTATPPDSQSRLMGQGLGAPRSPIEVPDASEGQKEVSPTGNPSVYALPDSQSGAAKAQVYQSLGTTYSGTGVTSEEQVAFQDLREKEDTGTEKEEEELKQEGHPVKGVGENLRGVGKEETRGTGTLGLHPGRR